MSLQPAPRQSSSPPQVTQQDLGPGRWPLTHPPLLSDVAEAIRLSDPWLLQALYGPQLPPQAREGPFSQRAAGA